jgi:integrase
MVNAYVQTLGRSFASGTVSNSLSVVSIIFRWAIFNNLAKTNPADQVDVPAGLRKSKRPAATPEQVAIIKANTTDFGLVANLLLYTGLRLGEACALTYADIDRYAKTIRVNKQVIWEGNRPQLQTTKTANGIRTIVIPEPLFAILPQGKPCTYIVGNDTEPITRNAFHCRWLHWCKDMDMVHDKPVTRDGKPTTIHEADVTPHQLRHNYATILWEAGVPPEVAQKLMGHSDIHTTQQIYLEIRGDHLSDAADILNRHFNGTK